MQTLTVAELLPRYRGLLIDAYGVLVDARGVLPGAPEFLRALDDAKLPFLVVTNDASRLPERISQRLRSLDLDVAPEQVVSSAALLVAHFAAHGLRGATAVTLGSPDAFSYVRRAGATPVTPVDAAAAEATVVVVCDLPPGDDFTSVARTLEVCIAAVEAGRKLQLVLCNPDVIYPAGPGRYGLTSGAVMLLLEAGLKSRFGAAGMPPIARLGKPHPEIFAAACAQLGTRQVAMLGDQLATDIQGAADFGIDSVLLGTGLTRVTPGAKLTPSPTFYLPAVGPA